MVFCSLVVLFEEIARVGAIIFGGNFMARWQFSGEQFSSGRIILGGNCAGVNCRGPIFLGGD